MLNTNTEPRRRRRRTTYPKRIYLTESGQQQIETWAASNGLTFSAANESLAALGADHPQEAVVRAAVGVIRQEFGPLYEHLRELRRQSRRLAEQNEQLQDQLAAVIAQLAQVALLAAANKRLAEGIILQLIHQMATKYPQDFVAAMNIQSDTPRGRQVRKFHEQVLDELWLDSYEWLASEMAWATDILPPHLQVEQPAKEKQP